MYEERIKWDIGSIIIIYWLVVATGRREKREATNPNNFKKGSGNHVGLQTISKNMVKKNIREKRSGKYYYIC